MPTSTLQDQAGTAHSVASEAEAVLPSVRRGPLTMGLVWVSMVASFPGVLIGLSWHKQGFPLPEVLSSLALCMVILLGYSVPMCTLAAKTGLSFKYLCHKYFGTGFSRLLTICLLVIYLGWYAVCSLLMADACCALGGLGRQNLALTAFLFSFAMAFNNFFGFTGVANFAKFVGAPAVICWIVYLFVQVAPEIPINLHTPAVAAVTAKATTAMNLPLVFCGVAQSIVGFVIWGNEADYWRNSTTGSKGIGFSLAAALIVGACVFPLTGWLIGAQTGINDPMVATDHLNKISFGGVGLVVLLFLAAQYFAANDSNLYAFVHAVESFTALTHKKTVLILALLAGLLAGGLALSGTQSALEAVCSLNGVLLPTASLIVLAEYLVIRRFYKEHKTSLASPCASRAAIIAWSAGVFLGIATSGIIPGSQGLRVGIPILEAWLLAVVLFLILRRRDLAKSGKLATAD